MRSGKLIIALAVMSLALIAFGTFWQNTTAPLSDDEPSAADGEQIYFTAENQRGGRIRYTGGPAFGGMMRGTYLTCASCHCPEGRGGSHVMHMYVMDAPDIRYVELAEEMEEHGGAEGEAYDLETFRRAVVDGEHPDGDALSNDMPRWQMSEADLEDLFEFLKSLP